MRRFQIIAVLVALAMSGSAFGDTFYGTVKATLSHTNANVGLSPNYYADYDLTVTEVTVDAGYDLTTLTDLATRNLEAFCTDPQNAATPQEYQLYNLTDDAALGITKGTKVQKLLAAAMTAGQTWSQITQMQFSDISLAMANVDSTVIGLQLAIWDVVGLNYGNPSNAYSTIRDALVAYVNNPNNNVVGVDAIAFVHKDTQNYAGVVVGGINELPEPSSLVALCGLGLMAAAGAYRRRRRA